METSSIIIVVLLAVIQLVVVFSVLKISEKLDDVTKYLCRNNELLEKILKNKED